ncbi:MAG TPA: hypothetical protein VHL11_13610, partial [Phototrophicaceae bacterium]|nr:hypothetical protein [Phototrophicaceae bacterium]
PVTDPYQLPASDHYDFPMPVIIGGSYYDLAFLWYYWWWELVPPGDAFANSRNFQVVNESLDTIAGSVPDQTCKALVFIPTKEMLYYRYIYDTERLWVRQNGNQLALADDGTIAIIPAPIADADEPQFMDNLYGQRNAIQKLVEAKPGWHFIDLTPAFEAKVGDGQLLYYPYDSHWNQAGHDLAAATIAETLQQVDGCNPPSDQP